MIRARHSYKANLAYSRNSLADYSSQVPNFTPDTRSYESPVVYEHPGASIYTTWVTILAKWSTQGPSFTLKTSTHSMGISAVYVFLPNSCSDHFG